MQLCVVELASIMTDKKLKIGVTGAAGFIGSNLCESLVKKGYKIIAVDDLSKGSKKNLKSCLTSENFTFIKLSILEKDKLSKAFKNTDVIIHLAASKIPRYGDRLTTLDANSIGTINVLEVAKVTKSKVIFASTSDVYGKSLKLPFKENANLVLGSPEVARWSYAASKIFDEHLCFAYWEKYKVPFVILRFFAVYGPKQHRSWWGGPQSLFIDAALNKQSVEIHGSGKQTRTFLYIDDATDAIIKAVIIDSANGQIINIGSNKEISIINFAKKISKMINTTLKIKRVKYQSFTGKKYEDINKKCPDLNKAKRLLRWEPKTSLKNGLYATIKWYKDNPL